MSVSILQSSSGWHPAYNDIPYVVASSNALSMFKFKYVCDVYATDMITRIARLKTPPRFDSPTGYAYFDIKRVIENYVTDDVVTDNTAISTGDNSHYIYGVKFAEEFATTSGSTSAVTGFTGMTSGWIFNGSLLQNDYINFTPNLLQVDTVGSTGQWLTDAPTPTVIASNERAYLHAFRKPGQSSSVNITYTLNQTGHAPITRTISWTSSYIIVPAGLQNIQEYFGELFPGIEQYRIQIGSIASTVRNYTIDSECTPYDKKRIHFLNRKGGYDSITLSMKSEVTSNIDRKNYGVKLGVLNGSTYGFDQLDRGSIVMDTKESFQYRFNSNWLTEEQMNWLNQLVSSPKILLENEDGSLLPLNSATSQFAFKKKQNDSLFQLELLTSFTITEIRQRY